MRQRGGDGQGALHPARELGEGDVPLLAQAEAGQQFFGTPLAFGARHAVQLHAEDQIVKGREFVVQVGSLGNDADVLLDAGHLRRQVKAQHAGVAGRGARQAGEHADGRRFAGAVGPQETEDLAFVDGEINPVHGAHRRTPSRRRVDFGKTGNLNHFVMICLHSELQSRQHSLVSTPHPAKSTRAGVPVTPEPQQISG